MNTAIPDSEILKPIKFEGRCPFLLCFEKEAHEHGICPVCLTVNSTPVGCSKCDMKKTEAYLEEKCP